MYLCCSVYGVKDSWVPRERIIHSSMRVSGESGHALQSGIEVQCDHDRLPLRLLNKKT